jgi:pilus assembly protein FimV
MLRKLALIVAIGPAMWFSAAHALGLGEIEVDSRLNQRFSAVIPLTSVGAEEAENLLVRLADNEDFAKAGIDRADYLSSLVFEVVNDKSPHIVVSSKQLAREPFINFLLDVRSANGRVLREYTVLLDPPAYAQAAPAKPVAVPAAASAPSDFYQTAEESAQTTPQAAPATTLPPIAPAAPAASAPAPESMPAPAVAGGSTYGPVGPGETLWSIASKLRPDAKISMDQMLWAIYSNNQGSFDGHHIQGLRKGSVLKVPAAADITAVSPAAAKTHLQQLRGHRVAAKSRKPAAAPTEATPTPVVPASKAEPAPSVKPTPKPETKPAIIPATPPAAEKKTLETVTPPAAPAKPVVAPAPAPAPSLPPPTPAAAAPPVSAAPVAPPTATPPVSPNAAATPSTLPSEPVAPATPAAVPVEQQAPAPAAPIIEPAPEPSSSLLDDWMMPAVAGAVVLLLALLGVRYWQKRQAGKSGEPALTPKATKNLQFWKSAAEAAPARTPPPTPPIVPSAKAGKFAAAVAAASVAAPPAAPKFPDPLAQTVIEKKPGLSVTQTLSQTLAQTVKSEAPHLDETSQLPNFDSTQVFGGHAEADALTSTLGTDTVDFDITGKFEAETLKVDLDTNDPVSEADFHLAYGLYDEAALLLESAAEKNPGRTDIRIKLAETYFRASKPHEFEEVAQSLKPQLDAAEWQKIAIMGSQLLPESPLFAGAATTAVLSDSVDLAFDEPVPATPVAAPARTVSPAATIPPSRSNSAVLDFKLEDLEAPRAAPSAPAKSEARVSTGNTLEFNLSEFDLGKAEEAAAAPAASDDHALEFDLSGFDEKPAATVAAATTVTPAEDIRLEDFDLGDLPTDSHAISTGDEAGTKLDLARAYVDMGDNDMARSLLNEVLTQGSNDQKKEAQTLIQRLV